MKTVGIIQARMGSSRLPGKVLRPLQGIPMLQHQLSRLGACRRLDQLVVATTDNSADDPVESLCRQANVSCYRGSEHDVLQRFREAALLHRAGTIVRLTADCPMIDAALVDAVCGYYLSSRYDYVSNCQKRTFPRGLDVEVFSAEALELAAREADSEYQREHVTPFFYQNTGRFRVGEWCNQVDLSHLRWTVDTEEDFQFVSAVYAELYAPERGFNTAEVLGLLARRPDLVCINAGVSQKPAQ